MPMNHHNVPPYVPGRYAGPIVPPSNTEPTPPKRGIATWLKVLLIAGPAFVLLMVIVGALLGSPDSEPAGTRVAVVPSEATTTAATVPAPPAKPAATAAPAKAAPATIAEGTWEVPGEVKPGTYKVTAPGDRGDGWACYWARLKDMDGQLDSISDNGNLDAAQRGILVVKKSDRFVDLKGPCVWTAVR